MDEQLTYLQTCDYMYNKLYITLSKLLNKNNFFWCILVFDIKILHNYAVVRCVLWPEVYSIKRNSYVGLSIPSNMAHHAVRT